MKKLIFVLFITFSISSVTAQSFPGDITISPQAGVSLSTYFTSKPGFDPRISTTGGFIGEYYLSGTWSFRSGLIYDRMGAKDNSQYTQMLDYLTVPINANWHFGRFRNFYLNFGPSLSLLMVGRAENENGDVLDLTDEEGAKFKEYDLGMSLGIGYKFYLDRKTQLYIDYQGFGSIMNIVENLPYELRNSRNSLNVGIVFTLDSMKGLKRR